MAGVDHRDGANSISDFDCSHEADARGGAQHQKVELQSIERRDEVRAIAHSFAISDAMRPNVLHRKVCQGLVESVVFGRDVSAVVMVAIRNERPPEILRGREIHAIDFVAPSGSVFCFEDRLRI